MLPEKFWLKTLKMLKTTLLLMIINSSAVDNETHFAAFDVFWGYERCLCFDQADYDTKFAGVDFYGVDVAFVNAEKPGSDNLDKRSLPCLKAVFGAEKHKLSVEVSSKKTLRDVNFIFSAAVAFSSPTLCGVKCLWRARTIPQLSWSNTTCHAPPSVAFQVVSCGKWTA